jgi:hypothetical protein
MEMGAGASSQGVLLGGDTRYFTLQFTLYFYLVFSLRTVVTQSAAGH